MEKFNINETKDTVLVTAFGPFGRHKINASSQAMKLLPSLNLEEELGINLVTMELPVVYETVKETVPRLWEVYQPRLVVHVGVGSCTGQIELEIRGFNSSYCKEDINGCIPKDGCWGLGCPDSIETNIDVRRVCNELNELYCDAVSCVSNDAGQFLCDFTYYTSLNIDRNRTVFIHVPELDKPFSVSQLAELLKHSIKLLLTNVRETDDVKLNRTV